MGRLLRLVLGVAVVSTVAAGQTETIRVSVDSSGLEGNNQSYVAAISGDGQVVVFMSSASNLVSGDTNRSWDIFVKDLSTGVTDRASIDSTGVQGNRDSGGPSISADGRFVFFASDSTNLVSNDTNGCTDLFVHDRVTGLTERVSLDSFGAQGDSYSYSGVISSDAQVVAFPSDATNFVSGDTNGCTDVFIHDRSTGVTERVSVDSSGAQTNGPSGGPRFSGDCQFVAFESAASNLVPGDGNGAYDVFLRDRANGTTERISVDSAGVEGDDVSMAASISTDGRFAVFVSLASNLVVGDTNGKPDIFLRDRLMDTTERVSVDSSGAEANDGSYDASISSDGMRVVFDSGATNLVAGDTNNLSDVFLHDLSTGVTERVSVDSSGAQGDRGGDADMISANGESVVFSSGSDNLVLGDNNNRYDVFVRGFCSTPASWSNYGSGYSGTTGIPSFTSQSNPTIGSLVTLDLANSYAQPTIGLIFVGYQQTSLHSGWGGDLLVVPALTISTSFSYGANSYAGTIPDDDSLCGLTIDLQAIEADPGAAKGVSFTPGLELTIGH